MSSTTTNISDRKSFLLRKSFLRNIFNTNYKKLILISISLFILISLLPSIQASGSTVIYDCPITEDGDIDISYNQNDTGDDMTVSGTSASGTTNKIYFELDLSSIPDASTITDVSIDFNVTTKSQLGPQINLNFHNCTVQPSLSTAQQIWDNHGFKYEPEFNGFDVGAHNWSDWQTNPSSDIQANLTDDWFAFILSITVHKQHPIQKPGNHQKQETSMCG